MNNNLEYLKNNVMMQKKNYEEKQMNLKVIEDIQDVLKAVNFNAGRELLQEAQRQHTFSKRAYEGATNALQTEEHRIKAVKATREAEKAMHEARANETLEGKVKRLEQLLGV